METNTFVIITTAVGTFIATVFGKEGWAYFIRKKEIEGGHDCQEEITKLQIIIGDQKLKTKQIITGVDMMLTMLEDEFGEDVKYKNVLNKVREYIKNTEDEE